MKIAISLVHLFMCIMGFFQLLTGSKFHPIASLLLVVGYGCSGFSLLSIGGKIFKWIAIVTNSIFVVFSLVGIVHFAVTSPPIRWSIWYRGFGGVYNIRNSGRGNRKAIEKGSHKLSTRGEIWVLKLNLNSWIFLCTHMFLHKISWKTQLTFARLKPMRKLTIWNGLDFYSLSFDSGPPCGC